jgi:hypothetical protein
VRHRLLGHRHKQRGDRTGKDAWPGVIGGQVELGREACADQLLGLLELAAQHTAQVGVGPDRAHLQPPQLGVVLAGGDAALDEGGEPLDQVVVGALDPGAE